MENTNGLDIEALKSDIETNVVQHGALAEKMYELFVKELLTATANIAKNNAYCEAFSKDGESVMYCRGKKDAFQEIHDRILKEYELAKNHYSRTPADVQKNMEKIKNQIMENVFPWEKARGNRELERKCRSLNNAMCEAMATAFEIGRRYQNTLKEDEESNSSSSVD